MKYLSAILLILITIVSCVSSGPFKQDLQGTRAVIQSIGGESAVNVCRQVDLNENSIVCTLNPGESVKVIKTTATAALVQVDNKSTGWIDIKFLKNSQ